MPKTASETSGPDALQDADEEMDAFKRAFKQRKGEAHAGKMEGVGTGALEAAKLHKKFDLEKVIATSPWKTGEPVPYAFLAATFDDIAPESKRLAIISMLTAAFRAIIQLTPDDLLPAVYLCLSKVMLLSFAELHRMAHANVVFEAGHNHSTRFCAEPLLSKHQESISARW